jgi:hypothetical protein
MYAASNCAGFCGVVPVAQSVDHSFRDPKVGSSNPGRVRPKTLENGDWFVGVSILLPTVLISLLVERDVKSDMSWTVSALSVLRLMHWNYSLPVFMSDAQKIRLDPEACQYDIGPVCHNSNPNPN